MSDGDRPDDPTPAPDEPSFIDLLVDLWDRSGVQVRGEIALAKSEFREKLKRVATGLGSLIAAALVLFLGLGSLVVTCIAGLVAAGLAPSLAGLVVTAALFLITGLLAWIGLRFLDPARLKMTRTTRSVRKDYALVTEGPPDARPQNTPRPEA